jgi:VCBS repeat-containing protein
VPQIKPLVPSHCNITVSLLGHKYIYGCSQLDVNRRLTAYRRDLLVAAEFFGGCMGTIRVESVAVQSYFLGFFGFDHLQLVYQDETDILDRQDYWFALEGIQDGPLGIATLGASGQNGHTTLGTINGAGRDDLIAKIGTPESRGSRIITTGPSAFSTWNAITSYAGEIDTAKFPYIAYSLPFSVKPTLNSTSLIASALNSVGIDLNNVLPFTLRLSPGAETILGTSGPDDLATTYNFTTVATGADSDNLHGSSNSIWLDKLYGGSGDDTLHWSRGDNVLHGGQPRLSYADDGFDTVDYSGAGVVKITTSDHPVDHKVAEFTATFSGGTDQLFSIENVTWDSRNDTIIGGPGIELLEKPVELDLKGNAGGLGDQLGFADSNTPLLVNFVYDDLISVQTQANEGLDAGYWVKSAEWFSGSSADDKIYAGASILGIEGNDGNDTLDGLMAAAFTGLSPQGYDIELYGGQGDDTIVSGAGRTFAQGGDGADRFVLSSLSSGNGTVEFVIDDAGASDKLYVPYNYFAESRGGYDGSQLFQLTGAVFKIDPRDNITYFYNADPGYDQVHGYINFTGLIYYQLEGDDLLVTLVEGHTNITTVDYGPDDPPGPTLTLIEGEPETATMVRVRNWSDGDLGITFPLVFDPATDYDVIGNYPGFHTAITNETAADKFIDALDARPDAHLPKGLGGNVVTTARALAPPVTDGTAGNDIIIASRGGPYHISGRGGDDDITGSDGGDVIDGGAGADIMRGGLGNDVYYVSNAGDLIIETARGGFDKVFSTIDYQLGDFVEHLTLEGTALRGTGNELRNTLQGNAYDNILSGGGGDDTLSGEGGNDTLIGGDGGDGYVYELGDGRDTIIETGAATGKGDVIVLAGSLKAGDISFVRNPDHNLDLTLTFADGGSLTIKDYFAGSGPNIEGIEFASGGTWSSAELAAQAATAIVTRNTAPVAHDDRYSYLGPNRVVIPVAALLDNDTDINGDHLSVSALRNITGGTAILDGLGNIVVTRTDPGNGDVTFDYRISDGHGGISQAAFSVSIVHNSAPVITSSHVDNGVEDHATTGRIIATDADNDLIGFHIKSGAGPAKGNIVINDDGTFVYTPNANANGHDSFTLTVSDGLSAPLEQRFDLEIAAVNDAPVAYADTGFKLASGGTLKIDAATLLSNDTDVENDHLLISSVSSASGGTAVRTADGGVTFKAAAGYSGAALFNYTISDGHGGTASATVSINVQPPLAKTHYITGTRGRDVLVGTHDDDVFIGKASRDVFVFRPGNGHDQINDFETGNYRYAAKDVLDLRGNGFTGYDDLTRHIHQSGADTIISLHDGGTIRLKGINEHYLMIDSFKIF